MTKPGVGCGRGNDRPTFLSDRIEAVYQGEEITIWNRLSVTERHYVLPGQIETEHEISVWDDPGGESPEYITPEMDDHLSALDVYPNAEVVDPHSDEVELI